MTMPTWIEKLAWQVGCPTCEAHPGDPCRSVYEPTKSLEFNHPTRNRRFHLEQQRRRAHERRNPVVKHRSGSDGF